VEFGVEIGEYQVWSGSRGGCSRGSCASGPPPSGASNLLSPADLFRGHRRAEAAPEAVDRGRECGDQRAGFALAPAVAVRGAYELVRAGLGRFGDAACWMRGPLTGDADAGPNPGGGFYGAPNLNVGRINP
jgi:hypothetical protein